MSVTTTGLLVVGGGPAAHAAVIAYRGHGGPGPVLLVSADDSPPYLRPPLTKELLRGGNLGEDDLLLDDLTRLGDVEVRTRTTVASLEPGARTARLGDGGEVRWRACVLATGSEPVRLPVPGDGDAYHLRSLADARALLAGLHDAGSVVVVGSGFIGCEAAASLAARGLDVTVCSTERVPQASRLGDAVGNRIADWLRGAGVRLRGDAEVTGIESTGGAPVVQIRDGEPVAADLVLVAAGARPRLGPAEAAGVLVEDGRVVVDEHMRTAVPGVFAAGDVARAFNAAAGRHIGVEHWGDAEEMGAVAGAVAAGSDARWDAAPGFWSEIGDRVLKYSAWGDGFDEVALTTHPGGGFTAWYQRQGLVCGVATHQADEDYERGSDLVRRNARASEVADVPTTAGPRD
ncbi:NAD(P)/FAD-dependent oxidoreductase [Pseudonocardia alni]|uniref:NAD(P)/FAD-dependent oxidoreductase n=1 Tax=Pseudonocardia TaxID=1847 RepID=UPI00091C14FC|nr:NAD(P)/FAD-dependent oxidoreductase [Pseudonocardia sp. SID8383]MYW73636.1 FAD-dependent oxidoreductase [Pseudonocardia sp. SID8383]OJG07831.1 Ferredoxin--NAD(P)(+) reductase fdr [Pseudonocardia autotrophica]